MISPEVSIIMATYNRAHFIVETLRSIQNQTFKDWECLIIDDGGTDDTLNVINPILKKDSRFKYLSRPIDYKKGLPGCRNYGLDIAKGEFIIFFDDDDVVHPYNLEICHKLLLKKEYMFCAYAKKSFQDNFNYQLFNNDRTFSSKLTNDTFYEDVITNTYPLSSCSVLWNKECFEDARFNENLMYAEEWELFSRILSEQPKGIFIDKVLYFNRKHLHSNTGEFYSNNPVRLSAKKEAIRLIATNLESRKLLSHTLYRYLYGLAISYRDKQLFNHIVKKGQVSYNKKLLLHLKYWIYPMWKFVINIKKTINK